MSSSQSNENISERLKLCASFVPKGSILCDVGTDHAKLPLYLIYSGICSKVIASDVNELPLLNAKKHIRLSHAEEKIKTVLCDGITELFEYSPDCFVIAGMSGETIISIIDSARCLISEKHLFILQPMSRDHYLRQYLSKNGFEITKEKACFENNKVFVVIFCRYTGHNIDLNDEVCYVGDFVDSFPDNAKYEYLKNKIISLQTKINGKRSAGIDFTAEERILKYIFERYKNENF